MEISKFFWIAVVIILILSKGITSVFCLPVHNTQTRYLQSLDSLQNMLKTAIDDAIKVRILNILIDKYSENDPSKALEYGKQALSLGEKSLNAIPTKEGRERLQKSLTQSYNNIGTVHILLGNYQQAFRFNIKALKICKKTGDKTGMADSYNNLGRLYWIQGSYEQSIKYYLRSLKICEESNNKTGIARALNGIGLVYWNQRNYEQALHFFFKSLKLHEETDDKQGLAFTINNIGIIYDEQGNYEQAMECYFRSLKIEEERSDEIGVATSCNNIGIVYYEQGKFEQALQYYFKSLKIDQELDDKKGIAACLNNIAMIYSGQGKLMLTLQHLNKSLALAKEIGAKDLITINYENIADIYAKIGAASRAGKSISAFREADPLLAESDMAYKKAYEYHQLYSDLKDSMFNEKSSEQIAEMSAKYESEKKDKELIKKDAKLVKQQAKTKRQRTIIISIIAILTLTLASAILLYNRFRIIRRQKNLIQKQKAIVDEKNKDITDSIHYAGTIQQAILPNEAEISSVLPEYFIYFAPVDVVSGDFYWFVERNLNHGTSAETGASKKILIAACDCTGHGVPGAFVSIMGNDLLNQIIIEKGLNDPGEILSLLNNGIKSAFTHIVSAGKESRQEAENGMDIALCCFNRSSSFQTTAEENEYGILEFAGANNPLIIVRKSLSHSDLVGAGRQEGAYRGKNKAEKISQYQIPKPELRGQDTELIVIKGDRTPIGGNTGMNYSFTNHKIKLKKDDTIYIFSDGYQDQTGGEKDRKFMQGRFRELLLEIYGHSMEKQKDILKNTIEEWKENQEQVDDILVIGIRY